METLDQALVRASTKPLGLLLHLGATVNMLDVLRGIDARHVLLVQGDPDQAEELRHACVDSRVLVQERVVTGAGGQTPWHRYNLASLNGPLDADGLSRFYPRLRRASVLSMVALPFSSLLASALPPEDERPNVLVLDLPGQEHALLLTVPVDLLQRFDHIVIRGCRAAPDDGWVASERSVELLQANCFEEVNPQSEQDPLWPIHLLRFDRARHELQLRDQHLKALEVRVHELEPAVASLHAEREALTAQVQAEQQKGVAAAQALAAAESLAAERSGRITELESTVRHHEATLEQAATMQAEVQAQVDRLTVELAEAMARATKLQRLNDMLTEEKAAAERLATERATRIAQLEDAAFRQAAGQNQLTEQARRDRERIAELERMVAQAEVLQEQQRKALEERTLIATERGDITRLTGERDAQAKLATERAVQSNERNKRVIQLEGEVADLQRRLDVMHQELAKAEGQLDLLRELLLQEPSL